LREFKTDVDNFSALSLLLLTVISTLAYKFSVVDVDVNIVQT